MDKNKVGVDEKMEQDDEWLSTDSANGGNESDSTASDDIPPSKMARLQYQKNIPVENVCFGVDEKMEQYDEWLSDGRGI
uniref:Uncharacterized protein n=1 Tax=Globodera rostochiensis TaxID=31243 RepID=A0A914HTE0_GLORO